MTTELTTTQTPATVEAWVEYQKQQRLQIEQLGLSQTERRTAELVGMLETASSKIDRFGWGNMDEALKDSLCGEWCDVLSPFTLDEVRRGVRAVFDAAGGKLRSINEFQVKAEIQKEHARIVSALPRASAPEPIVEITEEERQRRAAIVASAMKGFGGKP